MQTFLMAPNYIDQLIEALEILRKYAYTGANVRNFSDHLYVLCYADVVSEEDKKRLAELHFYPRGVGGFYSTFYTVY